MKKNQNFKKPQKPNLQNRNPNQPKSPNLTNSHNFYFIRLSWNLLGSLDRAMINPMNSLIESKRQKRVHGVAGLALVLENITIGGGSLIGRGRKSNSAGGFEAKKSGM